MALPDRFETELTKKLGIRYPIMCAGMGHTTGAELAAAVTNAGGIGTIGAIGLGVDGLRAEIQKLKRMCNPGGSICGTLPFGVDLLLPQVGGNARKTNSDYTGGQLGAFVDVMCEEKVPLFVCAVGIPPKWVVDKMHAAGMIVANMAGHPKHVKKALDIGTDIIIATGGEGGAHSGDISTLVLVPQCADMCKKGGAILVGGGGVYDGRGVAACMALGASGVWVGTRFYATPEANATPENLQSILKASSADTRRIEIYTGRPLRVIKNPLNDYWANNEAEMRGMLAKGVVPMGKWVAKGEWAPGKKMARNTYFFPGADKKGFWNDVRVKDQRGTQWVDGVSMTQAGQCIGGITEVKPAAELVKDMLGGLISTMQAMGRIGGQVPSRL